MATFVLRLEWYIRKFILTPQMMGYFKADLPRWAMWTLSTSEYVRQLWQDVVAEAAEDGKVAADVSTAVLELAVRAYMRSRIRMARIYSGLAPDSSSSAGC